MYKCTNDLQAKGQDDPFHVVAAKVALVHEYVSTVEKAPLIVAETLDTEYKLLCEYNGTVLAGKRFGEEHGYQFVTWDRSPDSTALNHGHYYKDGYEQAKLDFAVRSGMVQQKRQFTDEQLVEIYDCVEIKLNNYAIYGLMMYILFEQKCISYSFMQISLASRRNLMYEYRHNG